MQYWLSVQCFCVIFNSPFCLSTATFVTNSLQNHHHHQQTKQNEKYRRHVNRSDIGFSPYPVQIPLTMFTPALEGLWTCRCQKTLTPSTHLQFFGAEFMPFRRPVLIRVIRFTDDPFAISASRFLFSLCYIPANEIESPSWIMTILQCLADHLEVRSSEFCSQSFYSHYWAGSKTAT